ncbi:hypothetical protein E2C01_093266 [Portunus trituberculatus]|uniref:Uncharacterized protein n=1 Tax=Portunus trituberculatus TaxID=210409 RepID=A0A5B7JIJ8_PORTR|nr:hypothetical protein [Portunus trituberculatus]
MIRCWLWDKVGMEGQHDRSRRPSQDTEATGTSAETGRRKGGQAGNGARV